jgi:serine protease inhibitor
MEKEEKDIVEETSEKDDVVVIQEEDTSIDDLKRAVEEEVAKEEAERAEEEKEESEETSEESKDEVVEEKHEEEKVEVQEEKNEEVKEDENHIEKDFSETKETKKGNGIIILLVVLILLGALVVCYFLFFKKDNKPVSTKNEVREVKSEYRMSGNGLENFDLYFMKLENGGKNQVYSPLSIKYALEMLAEGANGNSKAQLDAVIGDYKARKYVNSRNMSFANAMFIRNTFKDSVKKDYTDLLKEKYDAEVMYDSFATPNTINNWVSNKTFKMINNLLNDVSQNDFVLVNALAIDMDWNYQIHWATGSKVPNKDFEVNYVHEKLDEDDTMSYHVTTYPYQEDSEFPKITFNGKTKVPTSEVLADFNRYDIVKDLGEQKIKDTVRPEYEKYLKTREGQIDVKEGWAEQDVDKYLNEFVADLKKNYNTGDSSTDMYVYEDDSIRSFGKDLKEYNGMQLQYVGIMPKSGNLSEYVQNLDSEKLNKVIGDLKSMKVENFKEGVATRIRGNIPFFKFEYELKLLDDLQKLGIEDIFDIEDSDLSNMTSQKEVIDKAVHKANIEFSNDGIKAAAATAMAGLGAAGGGFDYQFKIPVEEINVTFDKPYLYLIRDKATGEVWFAGTVYEPKTTVK